MSDKSVKRVVVIGGGIVGLSTALSCLQRGASVLVVDRMQKGGDRCSSGNTGMVRSSEFVPLAAPEFSGRLIASLRSPRSSYYVRPRLSLELFQWGLQRYLANTPGQAKESSALLKDLLVASREMILDWSLQGIDCSLAKKGMLILCRSEQSYEKEAIFAQNARQFGIPAQTLTAAETTSLEPNVTMSISGSIYYAKECHLDPSQLLQSLRSKIETLGGIFVDEQLVDGWITKNQSVHAIKTRDGEMDGDEFVLCGGAWSQDLVRSLRIRIPMQAGKGYALTLPNPIEMPSVCSVFSESRIAVTPIGTSVRFGGTTQIDALNQTMDPRRIEEIIATITQTMPRFKAQHFEGIQPWVGLSPISPDGLPYIGRTAAFNNLLIATGHANLGISLGPITGDLIGRMVFSQPIPFTMERLSPDRYAR